MVLLETPDVHAQVKVQRNKTHNNNTLPLGGSHGHRKRSELQRGVSADESAHAEAQIPRSGERDPPQPLVLT
jgi:hypothetical protein